MLHLQYRDTARLSCFFSEEVEANQLRARYLQSMFSFFFQKTIDHSKALNWLDLRSRKNNSYTLFRYTLEVFHLLTSGKQSESSKLR